MNVSIKMRLAVAIDQVSQTVTQMDNVTQKNAALVEQASAAAQSLEDQARSLRDAVAVFKLVDDETTDTFGSVSSATTSTARRRSVASMPKAPIRRRSLTVAT